MVKIEIASVHPQKVSESVWVSLDQVEPKDMTALRKELLKRIGEGQISDAVAATYVSAIRRCPNANPSDLWHHVLYRTLISIGYTDQQWKRISGFALERVFEIIYNPRLKPFNLRITSLTPSFAMKLFADLGFNSGEIKIGKLDRIVEVCKDDDCKPIAGLHIKASIAERIQDDVPASIALMSKGLLSIMLTMDAKSYPPPHGDGVNYGELGGRSWGQDAVKARIKRQYVEQNGQFDALISYNLRTPPTEGNPPSGKKIYSISFSEKQPDVLVTLLQKHGRK